MKVVIVAKTRMRRGACIGGITFDGRSVRLIAPDQEWNEQFNQEYNIGDVWDVEYSEPQNLIPPHMENIVVHKKRRLPAINDLISFIEHQMPPIEGSVDLLYDGLTGNTGTGALYINEENGVPAYSTLFWKPDKALELDTEGKRIRYRYPTPDGGKTLTFVGYQEPLPEIPAGTLLRVSLAHWWRPEERPDHELRCHVQLSGWFLPQAAPMNMELWEEDFIEFPDAGPYPPGPDDHILAQPPQSPISDPQSTDPLTVLQEVFGFDEFRPMQEEIIEELLEKRDSLAVMPTGSGKSLCYQLPALLFPGLTVVVSPLISLMEDQVAQLRELEIPAAYLNSTLSYNQYLSVTEQVRNGQIKLLYAAPETLLRPETLLLLEQSQVDCLTIDEAHCISEWGHDFRPEYRQLVEVRRRLPDAACLAVTATATDRVREDIKQTLHIPDAQEWIAGFDRDNLFLAVQLKTDIVEQTLDFLEQHKGDSGIIYCATRRQVDTLSAQLQDEGYSVLPYHAGLNSHMRHEHQRRFTRDDVDIIVATIAFGMGINKSNVRFILHVDLPKDLESYYQQIGRAGRDGLPADCLLLYSYEDVRTIDYFIQEMDGEQQRGAQIRLQAMLDFAESTFCRRKPLLSYFGEHYEADNCDNCDNCTGDESELDDLTIPAQMFLSCVKRTGEIFGMTHVIDVLRGSKAQKVLERGHHKLSTYNIGRDYSKDEWKHMARQFIQMGLLRKDMKFGSLKLTGKAYDVFKGEKVMGSLLEKPQPLADTRSGTHDRALFELLRIKRKALADAANLPPYTIFHDRTLVEMATFFPQSGPALEAIYGVGKAKLQKYADEFLPIIRDYCAQNGIEEKQRTETRSRRHSSRVRRGSRTDQVIELYNEGSSLDEIARKFSVKRSTVVNHLWKGVQAGKEMRGDEILKLCTADARLQQQALDAFDRLGTDYLRPVFDELEEKVSYDDLHLIRLHYVTSERVAAE
jgi:ATP-dependent DNA helicase RecQ